MEFEKVVFYDYRETKDGAYLKVHVPGRYLKLDENNKVLHGSITVDDGRTISSGQRKLIYATFRDIAKSSGDFKDSRYKRDEGIEYVKKKLKIDFMLATKIDYFSLGDVSMDIASQFIDFILEFCFLWEIDMSDKLVIMSKELRNWAFYCLKYRKCTICKRDGEIHHVDAIGAGRNRDEFDHTKSRLLCLCRNHHNEAHNIGRDTFSNKYHVAGIRLTADTMKKMKLKGKYVGDTSQIE